MHRITAATATAVASMGNATQAAPPEREAIHSGHFMVSHFEAEEQDDEDNLAVPVPEVAELKNEIEYVPVKQEAKPPTNATCGVVCKKLMYRPQIGIDTSLAKLFQCMSLAYRQKLTSPKWNRFRGIRLRWKDKIRLNNVIWRCWHMQFIKKQNTLICQFASPLDVDTHNKPEAVVLEGKYWKRKLAAVTAEYKKWRMFYRNQVMGHYKDASDTLELELLSWNSQNIDENMLVDEDYMGLMSDTLFSTITNQPFAFPDTREIAKAGLADFIQPSLGPLQPNLDDYMDTFEPLQELICGRLAPVPEESQTTATVGSDLTWYPDYNTLVPTMNPMAVNMPMQSYPMQSAQPQLPIKAPTIPAPSKYLPAASTYPDELYQTPSISKQPPPPTVVQKTSMELVAVKDFSKPPLYLVDALQSSYVPQQPVVVQQQQQQQQAQVNMSAPTTCYKFAPPPPSLQNLKFGATSQVGVSYAALDTKQKDDKPIKVRNTTRGRPRSRSNTRETIKKPPLLSAISDPSLISSSNSALLTQLLKTNNDASTVAAAPSQRVIMPLRVKEESCAPQPISILSQPPPPTTLILAPVVNVTPMRSNINIEPIMISSLNTSPVIDSSTSGGLNSPTPSQDSMGSPTRDRGDHRRAGHNHAEQKRRYNIKNGFDMIHSLIPHLNQNPNVKLSKAAMLQKGAEYIKQLRSERNVLKEEMDGLRQQIETLNASISNCQSMLPATGGWQPVSRRRENKLQEMFDEYVRRRTMEDWKFWIFSLIFQPLLSSFNNAVSTTSLDDLYRSTMSWVEQHCTLLDLRPVVLSSLRYLCTKTDILSKPERLPAEVRQLAQSSHRHPDAS